MDRVSTLLAQFPGPVRLAVSRLKWLAYMAIAAGFTVGAVDWIIEPGGRHVIAGWFGAIFFSLGMVAAAVNDCAWRFRNGSRWRRPNLTESQRGNNL